MFRRIADFSRRLFDGLSHAFRDFGNILLLPFRGGIRPLHSLRRLFSDIGGFFGQFFRSFNPRHFSTAVSRDSQSIMASSQMVALQTTSTVTSVLKLIVMSPVYLIWWLITAPPRLWYFLRTRTWLQLAIGSLVLAVGIAATAWPAFTILRERRRSVLRKEQDRQFELHLVRGSFEGVKHNLTELQKVTPGDDRIAARLAALDSGEAPPNDYKMAGLLMRHHYSGGNWPAAVREARKYLASNPQDWEALLILSSEALHRGDREAALSFVNQLPAVKEIPIWAYLLADRLFRSLNEKERLTALLESAADLYVPYIRTGVLSNDPPAAQLQMVELYTNTLTLLAERPQLKGYWVPVQEVCHAIANSKDSSIYVLANIGSVQENHLVFSLRDMAELKLITPEEHRQFADEIENRLTKIWERVRTADPKNVMAILGLAMQQARAGNLVKATAIIDDGIELCGDRPELIEKKADLLRRYDPAACLAFLEKTLAQKTLSLPMCRVLAQAALASNRPDQALEAINKAHAIQPNLPWVCQLEAQALVQAGRGSEAAGALRRVLPYVARDPNGVALYIQALAASNAIATAEQYLLKLLSSDKSSAVVVCGADKLAQLGHQESAVTVLRAIIHEQRNNTVAQVLLADCLRQLAEKAPGPGWDRDLISEAIKAYRAAHDRFPTNLQLINNIAWLELIALGQKQAALETSKPLREAKELPPEMLETIGAIHLAFGEYDDARIVLERAIQKRGQRALNMAFLAHAYHGLGRANDALLFLRQSLNLKKPPRDAEIIDGIRRLIGRSGG